MTMHLYLTLICLAAFSTTQVVSFAPAPMMGSKKLSLFAGTSADNEIQKTPARKETYNSWVANELNQGPPEWFQQDQKSTAKPKIKEYDWFSVAMEHSFDSLKDVQVSGPATSKNLRGSDWFTDAIKSSAPVVPETAPPLMIDRAPHEWFTTDIKPAFPSRRKQGSTTEWFAEAIKASPPSRPMDAPALDEGPSSWFAQAIASGAPSKPKDAPLLKKQDAAEWFSAAIKADAPLTPEAAPSLTGGPNEWFSQATASPAPVSPQVLEAAVPLGPSEWFTDAMSSMESSITAANAKEERSPHEWFMVGHADFAPSIAVSISYSLFRNGLVVVD